MFKFKILRIDQYRFVIIENVSNDEKNETNTIMNDASQIQNEKNQIKMIKHDKFSKKKRKK